MFCVAQRDPSLRPSAKELYSTLMACEPTQFAAPAVLPNSVSGSKHSSMNLQPAIVDTSSAEKPVSNAGSEHSSCSGGSDNPSTAHSQVGLLERQRLPVSTVSRAFAIRWHAPQLDTMTLHTPFQQDSMAKAPFGSFWVYPDGGKPPFEAVRQESADTVIPVDQAESAGDEFRWQPDSAACDLYNAATALWRRPEK